MSVQWAIPHFDTWFTNSLGGGPSEKSWLCGSANKRRALICGSGWGIEQKRGIPTYVCISIYIYMYIYKYIYIYCTHTHIYIIKHSMCIFFDDYVYDISILYAFEFVWTKSFDPDTCHDVIIRILINLWLDTVVCLLVRWFVHGYRTTRKSTNVIWWAWLVYSQLYLW